MSINLYSQGNPFSRVPCGSTHYTRIYQAKQSLFEKQTSCYLSLEEYDISPEEAREIYKINQGRNISKSLIEKGIGVRSTLVIDIDGNPNGEADTFDGLKRLVAYLIEKKGLKDGEDFFIHFSGKKGFHLVIPCSRYGAEFIEPVNGTTTNFITFAMAEELVTESGMPIFLFDRTIKYPDKIMRVAYSKHDKVNAYCAPVSVEDIMKSNWDALKEAAKVGKVQYKEPAIVNTEPHPQLVELYQKHLKTYTGRRKIVKLPLPVKADGFLCGCVQTYVDNCNLILAADYNRFSENMPYAIAAYTSGGEAELNKFHESFARNMGNSNPEAQAETWTAEIVNTIKNKQHSCVSGPNAQGSYVLGTKTKLERLIRTSGKPISFQCNSGCPLRLVMKGQKFGEFINKISLDCGTNIKELFVSAVFDYFVQNGFEKELREKLE